ncbi:MAG: proline dehydrogenase family protein [Thermomicrobiales bacterium]
MVLRAAMLWLAGNTRAEDLVRRAPFSRSMVERFVAGEDAGAALATAKTLHDRGLQVSLDLLGENAPDEARAAEAGRAYLALLDQIEAAGLPGNISIKLTMLGLDISDELAWEKLEAIVRRADELEIFVRVDMEGSDYTERTLGLFRRVHDLYPKAVGIVLQSYLYRTDRDLDEMIERGARVRIVKGAYKEPETVAYPHKSDVDAAFRRHIELLLEDGNYPAFATHDEAIIRMTQGYALRMGVERSRFEFQMLYGIGKRRQEALVAEGYNMRVYVPYGTSWYPYFMRRLAERPANVLFILRQMLRS